MTHKPFEFEISYVDSVQYRGQRVDFDITITGGSDIDTDYDEVYLHSQEFEINEEDEIIEIIQNKYKEIIEKLWN